MEEAILMLMVMIQVAAEEEHLMCELMELH